MGLSLAVSAVAKELNYDRIPITPQTWEEVDLTYINTIDGKKYTEHANLLRPITWVKQNHLDKIGAIIYLAKGQLGIDADATVIAINPTTLNYNNNSKENIKPVIATFITHSNDVWDYTFKDQQGHQETVKAVSSHPFYVPHLNSYVPIGQIESGEQLKDSKGNNVILIGKILLYQVETVYNFEVYKNHNYFVGNSLNILAHNPGGFCCTYCRKGFKSKSNLNQHILTHTKPFVCDECHIGFARRDRLKTHMLQHSAGKPFVCDECGKGFIVEQDLNEHISIHINELICPACSGHFRTRTGLTWHKRSHNVLNNEIPGAAVVPEVALDLQPIGASAMVDEVIEQNPLANLLPYEPEQITNDDLIRELLPNASLANEDLFPLSDYQDSPDVAPKRPRLN